MRRALALALLAILLPAHVLASVGPREVDGSSTLGPTTQTGTASWYGPGSGVATQWCTWAVRHSTGCGWLAIQSLDTGIVVVAPVIDWCQCYRGTPQERIVDLQLGVVAALGLDPSRGLYPVTTWLAEAPLIPDTAMAEPTPLAKTVGVWGSLVVLVFLTLLILTARGRKRE